jgi:hypothetical protein
LGCGRAFARTFERDEFIREFEPLAERNFAGVPAGTLLVEGLDAQQRVCWSAHYKSVHGVVALLRQLREERRLAARPGA